MGRPSIENSPFRKRNFKVEVTSEEEGFTGAWYPAKVIDPRPKRKPNQVYIQYETLLDEKSSKPLREYVKASLVRPSPPPEPERFESFKVGDVVDALYKDGWWTGEITNVFQGNSRFEVTFKKPPDLIVFEQKDLRLHRNWVEGEWVEPEKQQKITGLLFSKGKKVEVSLEKEESSEVWFPAIVEEDTGNGSFLVEYQCLGKNDEPESVKVKVDSLRIRPSPPQLKGKNYDLLEKVDAYFEFGWRRGVLTKELADNKYIVFFKDTNIEKEFNLSEIRPHMEWKQGNWFSTSQGVSVVAPDSMEELKVNSEEIAFDSLNSLDLRMEFSTPSSTKPSTPKTWQQEKAKLVNPGPEDSMEAIKHADDHDLPLLPTDGGIHFSSAPTNGSARINNLEQFKVDLPSENFSRGKRVRTKCHKVDEVEYRSPQRLRSVGRPPKSRTKPQALAGDKRVGELEHCTPKQLGGKSNVLPISKMTVAETPGKNDDTVIGTEENLVQKDCVIEVPMTHNPAAGILSHPPEVLVDVSGDQQIVHVLPVDGIMEADQLERHVVSTGKRKRGRPPKLQRSPEVGQQKGGKKLKKGPEVTEQNGGVTAEGMDLEEAVLPVVVGLEATMVDGSMSNEENIGLDKNIFNGLVDKNSKSSSKIDVYTAKKDKLRSTKSMQVLDGKPEKDSLKRGKRRALNIDAGSPNQDLEDQSAGKNTDVMGKDSLVKEAETPTTRLSCNMSDDEPLSMWLEAPKTADATGVSQRRNVEKQQCTTNCSRDIAIRSPQCNDQILPFVKNCKLWETIESMSVCRQFPQNPHFRSLLFKKESCREGLAIALMVDFVNVVEGLFNLQPDTPRDTIKESLETLSILEDDGFDVKVVRDRYMQVLLTMDKRDELVAKAKESTDQMKKETKEDEKINEQLRLLQERKVEKVSSIAHLKSTVNDINESIRNVDLEFQALVAPFPYQVG